MDGRTWRVTRAVTRVPVVALALLVLLALLAAGTAAGPARAAVDGVVAYRAPVAGPLVVVRGFDDVGRYDPGHRGVDLRVPAAGQALAAGAGTVTFADPVAGRGVVTVQHADGVRTSYEPVTPAVRAGAVVAAGAVLGVVAGAHGTFPAGTVLHWGARVGDRYVDPLALLAPLGPVRLLPWADP